MTGPRGARTAGFSFTETLLAVLLVALLFLPLYLQTSQSRRSSMDSYAEILAHELAQEPIELFRAFGYRWASTYGQTQVVPGFPLDTWQDVPASGLGTVDRPVEAEGFRRRIRLIPLAGPPRGIRIEVRVAPRGPGGLGTWLTQNEITQEAVIFEKSR